MPPQTNARLTLVTGATVAEAESYDGPAAAGAEKWAGGVAVYVRERRNRQQGADVGDVQLDRVLLVDSSLGVDWRVGDVVTFERTRSSAPETGRVRLVEKPEIDDADIPADLQTVRLTLETA